MKKNMSVLKTIVCSLLCMCFCAAAVACGGGGPREGIAGTITLNYFLGGFGEEWINAVAEDYTKNVNPDAEIKLKASGSNADMLDKIKSGTGDDMYIANENFFGQKANLLELDSVMEMEVYGEEGVKVKDKLSQDFLDYYNEGGHYYQFPQNNVSGYRWIYNKTVIDGALGSMESGNWSLPRTTDEFFELGDRLYDEGVFLTATAIGNGAKATEDYLDNAFNVWFAQMVGAENHAKFFDGLYQNEDGEWVRDSETSDNVFNSNKEAIEAAYALAKEMCVSRNVDTTKERQYLHSNSDGMQYKDVDVLFYGGQLSGRTFPRFAFIYSGLWLERETATYDAIGVVDMSANEVLPMKTPVISAIISRTPSIPDDTVLAQVVDYVDGVTAEKPAGVTDEDIAIIAEARNMVNKGSEDTFLITKNARYPDLCKDFLRYIVSDRAQQVAAKACSGISILPYGYEANDEDMGFEMSEFVKAYNELTPDAVQITLKYYDQVFTQKSKMFWYADTAVIGSNHLAKMFYTSKNMPQVSEIVARSISKYNTVWKDAVAETEAALAVS